MTAQHTPKERRLGRPPDVSSADTRKRLINAARQTFAREGYANATNKDIAAAAGITPGAIYHYFPSKADLYVAVLEEVQLAIQASYEKIAAEHASLLDRVGVLLSYAAEGSRRDHSRASFALGISTETQQHPELREPIRALRRRSIDIVSVMVAEAARNGELPPDVEPQAVEDLLNAIFAGLRRLSANPERAQRHDAAVALLRRLLAQQAPAPTG